jgi:endonuclease-3
MLSAEKIKIILQKLDKQYPWDGVCFLNYGKPWQLLFATILSAQCTDEQVNRVTEKLYADYPTLEAFANADLNELERAVYSTGFYKMKALHIKQAARQLIDEHGGALPSDIGKLTKLSGVGRKTANVVLSHVFKTPSVVVDTHVARVSARLGFTKQKDPVKIERELMAVLPIENWIPFNQQIITHGRGVCMARSPKCGGCVFAPECEYTDGRNNNGGV